MYALSRLVVWAAFVATIATPGRANEPAPITPASNPAEIASPVLAPAAASPIMQAIQQQLAAVARRGGDDQDRAAIAAFYGASDREPLWTTDTGLSVRAEAVLAELRAAADWGLSPAAFEGVASPAIGASIEARAAAEVGIGQAVLKYARHARGGRIDVSLLGRNFDQKPPILKPESVLAAIAVAPDAGAYLRGLHPQHPQFEKLRQALLAARRPQAPAAAEPTPPGADVKLPAGPRLKSGQTHPHVALLRQRLAIAAPGGTAEERFDAPLQAALLAFQQSKGLDADGSLNNLTRVALNGAGKPPATSSTDQVQRILVNMERWRWLPEDLGRFHVWDNIPEYRMRVLKNNEVVHAETIIVGKPSSPTPVFSADMKYVIFHPTWGVPDGIKMNEIAPSLRRSSGGWDFWGGDSQPAILRRHNLIVSQNGRPVNPASVNWQAVNIRSFQFTQPASATNVLGVVKFRFPNKHDVYMHDTPERSLFARAEKAFSHGCMRVQNPRRLAEVLLAEDKGWTSAQVGNAIAANVTQDVTLSKQIPVHVTYFTTLVEDDGRLKTFADLYGHDSRIASALEGKPVRVIAQTDPAVRAEREVRVTSKNRPAGTGGGNTVITSIFSGLTGN